MRKILTFFFSMLILSVPGLGAGAQPLTEFRVGADPDYRPFAFTNERGEAVGYDIDFAAALAARLGLPLVHQGMAWDGIIPALQGRRIDAITSMVITDARREQVAFSQPVLTQQIIVVVAASYDGPEPTAEQLESMRVGVQINTAAANVLNELDIEAITYNTVTDVFNDLALGRLDAVAIESVGGSYTVASAFPDRLKVTDVVLSSSPQHIAVALRKEDEELLADVDAAITAMKSDGELSQIAREWFGDANIVAE